MPIWGLVKESVGDPRVSVGDGAGPQLENGR